MYLPRAKLVAAILEARNGQWDNLYLAVHKMVRGLGGYYREDEMLADDIAQDVFVVLLRVLPRIDLENNPFAYLTSLARTCISKSRRANQKRESLHTRLVLANGHKTEHGHTPQDIQFWH